MSKFCILICTHNGEAHIEAQLLSILHQVPIDCQVFVHDWGSTDATVGICDDVRAKFHNLRVLKWEEAPGAAVSFMKSLNWLKSHALFDYIMLSDQDDIWYPDRFEVMSKSTSMPYSCFFSDVTLINNQGSVIKQSLNRTSTFFRIRHGPVLGESILYANPVIGMTMCIRSDLLNNISDMDLNKVVMHDWLLSFLAVSDDGLYYIDRPTVYYRQHRFNILGASGSKLLSKFAKVFSHAKMISGQERYFCSLNNRTPPGLMDALHSVIKSDFLTLKGKVSVGVVVIITRFLCR